MAEGAGVERSVVVLGRTWKDSRSELSFALRSVAGAASRLGPVTVLTPGATGLVEPDGAFDVVGVGSGPDDNSEGDSEGEGDWPAPDDVAWPASLPPNAIVIVDDLCAGVRPLLGELGPSHARFALSGPPDDETTFLRALSGGDPGAMVGLHVPVNPLAATHRHNGLGFVDYVLVLSDRMVPSSEEPPAAAAWLTAGLHQANIVVVENATASAWRGRALRGVVTIDSRTDLWRLMAHAQVCVDLAPGTIVARECVESLRYGTPIMVPADAPAAAHVASGGGLTFRTMADLLQGARAFASSPFRSARSAQGRRYADELYGDPAAFAARVRRALAGEGAAG
jgi:hypothetical protein